MHAITISQKSDHEFEIYWGSVYGSVWRVEREGINVITL